MTDHEDKSKIPYFMSGVGSNNFEDYNYQCQGPNFEYNNYQNNYRNEQYNNAYGNYTGGYGPNCGFNTIFPPPYPGFYGFPPFQFPPGPPQGPLGLQGPPTPQDPQESECLPDSSSNVSEPSFDLNGPQVKKKQMEDKIIKALIRCGVPKENLKNLPRNLLKRYQPDYCGLCSQSLDTFTLSRMHYISKNHLKNQKKWLSQQTESGFRRNKEQPLKARELYCEICDVHITSKVHSDSHYAGKPHRAIVEGRKNPKNPFLMQRGMEERLDQLIRREKKHFRLGREEDAEKRETKVIQPELYCQICDSSVTCSEQMIMHLNGKRHLAKEKQHILKMMKGDHLERQLCVNSGEERDQFENRPDTWEELRSKICS